MLENKGHPNRLGVRGWLAGGRWGIERYLYTLHRVTGLGLLAYFVLHILVTSSRAFGEGVLGECDGRGQRRPLFKVGEFLVFAAFAFHAMNGIRLVAGRTRLRHRQADRAGLSVPDVGGRAAAAGHRRDGPRGGPRPDRRRLRLPGVGGARARSTTVDVAPGAGAVILVLLGLHMTVMHLEEIVRVFNPTRPSRSPGPTWWRGRRARSSWSPTSCCSARRCSTASTACGTSCSS